MNIDNYYIFTVADKCQIQKIYRKYEKFTENTKNLQKIRKIYRKYEKFTENTKNS